MTTVPASPPADAVATTLHDCRKAFAATLLELAAADPRVVAVCNDSVGSSNLKEFAALHPERLVNVGIAEQAMVGVGAGLAGGGRIPFVCAASPFLTGRALEQIKADVAYSRANVKLCGMSPGFAYGQLGPTHHSIEDLAWLRALADLTVVVPADPAETAEAVRWAYAHEGPVFLRIGRTPVPSISPHVPFEAGRAAVLRQGLDVTLVGTGTTVAVVVEAAERLAARGVSAHVLNMSTVSPLDEAAVRDAAERTAGIVSVEEHTVRGGLGGAIAETVVTHRPVPMRILGVPGVFAPTGSAEFLFEHFRLTAADVERAALDLLGRAP
ncbi:transketolase C-terminal domain-containing protein [Streptomyces sp. B6B3]|uniref:transketolase family protein n=1 Tax=Streptomyces sp. B6B3 TaxID=3153570 RepID=UPI00325DDD27